MRVALSGGGSPTLSARWVNLLGHYKKYELVVEGRRRSIITRAVRATVSLYESYSSVG